MCSPSKGDLGRAPASVDTSVETQIRAKQQLCLLGQERGDLRILGNRMDRAWGPETVEELGGRGD